MSEKSKVGSLLEIPEIKGLDRPMQALSYMKDQEHILNATRAFFDMTSSCLVMTSSKKSSIFRGSS